MIDSNNQHNMHYFHIYNYNLDFSFYNYEMFVQISQLKWKHVKSMEEKFVGNY